MYYLFGIHIFFLILIPLKPVGAQTSVDSLKQFVESTPNDSLKIEALIMLAERHGKDVLSESIEYVQRAIEEAEERGYSNLRIKAINELGIIYYEMGNYEMTLECFYETLAYHEEHGDSWTLSQVYNNVGLILDELGRHDEALDYFEKSLQIKYELNDRQNLASILSNLGLIYHEYLKDYAGARQYFREALALDSANHNSHGMFISMGNLANNYYKMGELDSAHLYYTKAMEMQELIDDQYIKAELISDFGRVYWAKGEYNTAIQKFSTSLAMAQESGAMEIIKSNYKRLADTYAGLKNYKRALYFQKKYIRVNDKLYNEDKNRKIASIEKSYQIRSKQNEIVLLKKEAEIKDLKLDQSQLIVYWLGGILLLLCIIFILQYKRIAYKSRINKILEQKNQEILKKNADIMDSIEYARNIQEAILPQPDKLNNIFSEAFVLTRARNIVNGDFYWFSEHQGKIMVAAVDCTGHGVPAAFLNVIGNSLLNQIVNEDGIWQPAKVLSVLNQRIFQNLSYDRIHNKTNDGMDVAICVIDREAGELSFAGAKRELYLIRDGKLKIFKGDPFSAGGIFYDPYRRYHQQTLKIETNDAVYLFTDGIVDQFGGKENKKFMYPRLKKMLLSLAAKPMNIQKIEIEHTVDQWQGDREQTDDFLMIGIRI